MAKGKKSKKDKKKGKKKLAVEEVAKVESPPKLEPQPCDSCDDETCCVTKVKGIQVIRGKCRDVIAALALKRFGKVSHNLIMVAEKKPSPMDETKKKKKKRGKGKNKKKK